MRCQLSLLGWTLTVAAAPDAPDEPVAPVAPGALAAETETKPSDPPPLGFR